MVTLTDLFFWILIVTSSIIISKLLAFRREEKAKTIPDNLENTGIATTDIDGAGGQFQLDNNYLYCISASGNIIRKGEKVIVRHYDSGSLTYQVESIENEA